VSVSADLTSDAVRAAFLEKNKLWLAERLGHFTAQPRAPRGATAISDSDATSESERSSFPDALVLSQKSVSILRAWAAFAVSRAPGRLGRAEPVGISTDDGESEPSGPDRRFPAVRLSRSSVVLLRGWLAAAKSARLSGSALPSISDDDRSEGGFEPGAEVS
jgi:hypothetical protein